MGLWTVLFPLKLSYRHHHVVYSGIDIDSYGWLFDAAKMS